MTTNLEGVKQNPEPTKEDLRRMALTLNELIKTGNRGFFERKSQTSTGTPVTDNGIVSVYYLDATDADVVFNLQALAGVQDRFISVFKTDGSTNTVTVTPSSTSELVNEAATKVISSQFDTFDFHAQDLTNWRIL